MKTVSTKRKGQRPVAARRNAKGRSNVAAAKRRNRGPKSRVRKGVSRPRATAAAARRSFPGLRRQDGCGAMLLVAEHVGGEWEEITQLCEVELGSSLSRRRVVTRRATRISPRTCRALAALGNDQRVKIMAKLLEGPAIYRSLQRVTRLRAGPLYHHINQLRLAGLILPKQRDLYELTRGGRNLILAAMVVGPFIRDGRRRPQPRAG